MKRSAPSRKANLWVARIIPIFLLGIIGYGTWVVTDQICVDYLLKPDATTLVRPRPGAAIAILVIYYLLLIPLLVCYGRLIQTIIANPGYTPRGASWHAHRASRGEAKETRQPLRGHRRKRLRSTHEKETGSRSSDSSLEYPENPHSHPRIQDFWHKDVFVCNYDGRPPFCSTCLNWKSDRTHHCSEVDRCVRKMDHFCPWVGGIVSETSFKFFIQFLGYGALFNVHALIFIAYFFAERVRMTRFVNVHWILVLAFAALFSLFSLGMFVSSMQFALLNVTTIENFTRSSKIWYLCVYLPRPEEMLSRLQSQGKAVPRTIPYPRPPEENAMILHNALGEQTAPPQPSGTSDAQDDLHQQQRQQTRTFAILELPPGANPWDVGPLQNVREVLGYRFLDWFLPIKHSPCASHSDSESMFRLGPAVERAKKAAGLVQVGSNEEKLGENRERMKARNKRRKRRRKSKGTGDARDDRSRQRSES